MNEDKIYIACESGKLIKAFTNKVIADLFCEKHGCELISILCDKTEYIDFDGCNKIYKAIIKNIEDIDITAKNEYCMHTIFDVNFSLDKQIEIVFSAPYYMEMEEVKEFLAKKLKNFW